MPGSAPNGEYARAITKTTLVPSASESDDLVHVYALASGPITHAQRRGPSRAPLAQREIIAVPAWSVGSPNWASRGKRLMGNPVTESNLRLRAPAQRAA